MERLQYEESLKQLRDNKNVIDYARKEGRDEVRKEGRDEGVNKEKLASIKAGIEEGFTLKEIAIFTRLSEQELKEIIKEQGW